MGIESASSFVNHTVFAVSDLLQLAIRQHTATAALAGRPAVISATEQTPATSSMLGSY